MFAPRAFRHPFPYVPRIKRLAMASLICLSVLAPLSAQTTKQPVTSGKRYPRLVIRNAMIVDGNGTPASGPKDIVIENNRITEIAALDPVALRDGRARRPQGDVEIDATGKYVLPKLINAHGHVQYGWVEPSERARTRGSYIKCTASV